MFDFDAPPLVVGQVPVEFVEFVGGHQVEVAFDLVDGVEVAADVEVHAAPVESRGVADGDVGDPAVGRVDGDELAQGGDAHGHAARAGAADDDAVAIDGQGVGFGIRVVEAEAKVDVPGFGSGGGFELKGGGAPQGFGQVVRYGLQGGVGGNGHAAFQFIVSVSAGD